MTVAELAIGGMTCASCAARIERKLNRLDGVSAAVNFATETAHVTFPASVKADELVSAVERAGYTAVLAAARRDEPDAGQGRQLAADRPGAVLAGHTGDLVSCRDHRLSPSSRR